MLQSLIHQLDQQLAWPSDVMRPFVYLTSKVYDGFVDQFPKDSDFVKKLICNFAKKVNIQATPDAMKDQNFLDILNELAESVVALEYDVYSHFQKEFGEDLAKELLLAMGS